MSRIVGKPSSARERLRLLGRIGHALRAAEAGRLSPEESADVLAYIALSLREVLASVEQSISAWEKRGYWLKADRFRLEWRWAEAAYRSLCEGLARRAPSRHILDSLSELSRRTAELPVPARARTGKPWQGAARAWSATGELGTPK